MDKETQKIVEAEIDRLEEAYRNAQERYAYTGSTSTDRTMRKYQVLQMALENYLTNNEDRSKDRMLIKAHEQLRKLRECVQRMRGTRIEPAAADELLRILMEV